MASSSVFSGQLARTWQYITKRRCHTITLYHDTISGSRSVILNFEEVEDSGGISSLVMGAPHRIPFMIEDNDAYIEIRKNGMIGFAYLCCVGDEVIAENTQVVAQHQHEDLFSSRVSGTDSLPDDGATHTIVWYVVETRRLKDEVSTAVHRRFRDFVDLHEQIKQNLRGHHLFASIPSLPEKTIKIGQEQLHTDQTFIRARQEKLDSYLSQLLRVPHVNDMVATRAFLGLMESVRELSFVYREQQLGVTLQRASAEGASVGSIQRSDLSPGLRVGDSVSKINGQVIAELNFNGTIARIRRLPRPMVMHYIQVIRANDKGDPNILTGGGAGGGSVGGNNTASRAHREDPLIPIPSRAGDDSFDPIPSPRAPMQGGPNLLEEF